ncbi:hypothetical protein [Dyadobacter sandarakinus]|nr:hypothetical protein [Dyadobacter sandarakinus]
MEQLLDVINGLNELEKIQVKSVLEADITVSDEALVELSRRKEQFGEGNITARSWAEIRHKYD